MTRTERVVEYLSAKIRVLSAKIDSVSAKIRNLSAKMIVVSAGTEVLSAQTMLYRRNCIFIGENPGHGAKQGRGSLHIFTNAK